MSNVLFAAFVAGRSVLTVSTIVPATDILPIVRSGTTYKAAVGALPFLPLTGGTLTGAVQAATVLAQTVADANGVNLQGAAAASRPAIFMSGTDTNIGLNINLKGTGGFTVTGTAGANTLFAMGTVAGSDGFLNTVPGLASTYMSQIYNGGSGNNILIGGTVGTGVIATNATTGFMAIPRMAGAASGTPVLNGSGACLAYNTTDDKLQVYNSAWKIVPTVAFSANGTVASVLTSLGPSGSSTTVQEWMTVKNASGTVRYIPLF